MISEVRKTYVDVRNESERLKEPTTGIGVERRPRFGGSNRPYTTLSFLHGGANDGAAAAADPRAASPMEHLGYDLKNPLYLNSSDLLEDAAPVVTDISYTVRC